MSTVQQDWPVYALLADGSTVEIRPAEPGDFDAVKAMHEAMSPDNAYLRFFSLSQTAAETEARRLCREPGPGRMALLALAGGEVVGCASYDSLQGQLGQKAEAAFAVADHMHHRGIATLLLEHLVSYAGSHQITAFTGYTLVENTAMLKVFADAGLPVHRHTEDGVVDMTIPLPTDGAGTDLNNARIGEDFIDDVSKVLTPNKVAVVAEIEEDWTTPVDTRMEAIGGTVFRRALADAKHTIHEENVAAMKADVAQMKAEQAKAHADRKAKLQEKINQLDSKIQVQLQKAKDRREAAQREVQAKAQVLKAKAAAAKAKAS